MKKLIAKKGFTLVECVIAIAVFAILTTMILFIVGNAVSTNKKAIDQERNLNGLIENVVQDQSPKRYGDYDSDVLSMGFSRGGGGTADFTMTYSTIDGYKSYVQCPACAVAGNGGLYTSQEFMADAAYSSANYIADLAANSAVDTLYKTSHWFNPTTMAYRCPSCGTYLNNSSEHIQDPSGSGNATINGTDTDVVFSIRMRCLSCESEGYYDDCSVDTPDSSKSFMFDTDTGNYICQSCMSGNVVQVLGGQPITEAVSDEGLQISGMSANTIRYCNLEEPTAEKKVTHVTQDGSGLSDTEKTYTVELKADSSNPTIPTKYTIKFTNVAIATGHTVSFDIDLPGCYIVDVKDVSSIIEGNVDVTASPDYSNANSCSKITINNVTQATGSTFEVEFTLRNYINGNSFDYDYKQEGGLHKYWFGVDAEVETSLVCSHVLTFDPEEAVVIDPSKKAKTE